MDKEEKWQKQFAKNMKRMATNNNALHKLKTGEKLTKSEEKDASRWRDGCLNYYLSKSEQVPNSLDKQSNSKKKTKLS
jgi:hypothetical protein